MNSRINRELEIAQGPFVPTFESLHQFECPDWYRDAKLGFWSHWGPQAVPMYGDWYARHMYIEGHDQYRQHLRVYGHPSKFGYKGLVPLWKAEKFDPNALMELFVRAGGKYFVSLAVHHDNFDTFDSQHNRWNAVNMGPKKDIVALWQKAAKAYGLPFGVSEHLGASFNWFETSKGSDTQGPYAGIPYDGNDPAYEDLYHANRGFPLSKETGWRWYTDNPEFPLHWFDRIKDLIDRYEPDLLYSDGGLPYGQVGLNIVAHLFNRSTALYGANRAVYTSKHVDPEAQVMGVLNIERGLQNVIVQDPWQSDTSIGDWFYNVRDVYKSPRQILETLVDVVSKNGNMLLVVPQRPDGTIDDECEYLLQQMAVWMDVNGEGIFASRPWRIAGEGKTLAEAGDFKEAAVAWSTDDFRFTRKGETIYAYQMRVPQAGQAVIRALPLGQAEPVIRVRLLGYGDIPFAQTEEGLAITMPPVSVAVGPHGFEITPAGRT